MADDVGKKRGLDISKLGLESSSDEVAKAANGVGAAQRAIGEALKELHATRVTVPDNWHSGIGEAMAHVRVGDIQKRMEGLIGGVGADSALGKVARDIGRQQRAIDGLSLDAPPRIPIRPDFPKVENPLLETNARLARMEERFEKSLELAKDYAQVATGLQASAAEFLHKFQVEADKNNDSVNKTISVARWSLAVVIVVACAQIAAPFFLPDRESEALRETVTALRVEVETLRENQTETSERLIEALAGSDAQTAAALLEIAKQLENETQPQPTGIQDEKP